VTASSEDTLRMSKNGDLGSEGAVTKEEEVEMDREKEVEVEKEREKEVEVEKEREVEREKEVEVEKGIDPWSYSHGSLPLWWWLTAITIGPILLMLRLISLAVLLVLSFILVKLALLGNFDLDQPLVGWRRNAQSLLHLLIRLATLSMGVWVKINGNQESPSKAPLLVVAPHTTIIDSIVIGAARATAVAKAELSRHPFIGPMGNLLQTVWVDRGADSSKKETAERINRRAEVPGWPHTVIFPEGTTTNGKALIRFRTGAFSTGNTVQPVALRFPNWVDTLTWARYQSRSPKLLFFQTLLTPVTFVSIEYLPVVSPTEEELLDPRIFSNRVRQIMADHLDLPVIDQSLKEAFSPSPARHESLKKSEISVSKSSIDFVGNLTHVM